MQNIIKKLQRAILDYDMIQNGDKIAIGLSGGKDSLTLLTALSTYRKFSPNKFDILAISVDLFDGKSDFTLLNDYCKKLDVELVRVDSQINEIVFDIRKEKNPCALCAKLRRGYLNNAAKDNGCNKVALGHHADDLSETMFLSMFYEGRLSTFKPVTYLSRIDLNVIRPLIYVSEDEIISASKKYNMPVFFNCCPANHNTQREYIKQMLKNLENDIPGVNKRLRDAITHTERYNLLDKLSNAPYDDTNNND